MDVGLVAGSDVVGSDMGVGSSVSTVSSICGSVLLGEMVGSINVVVVYCVVTVDVVLGCCSVVEVEEVVEVDEVVAVVLDCAGIVVVVVVVVVDKGSLVKASGGTISHPAPSIFQANIKQVPPPHS